MPIEIISFPDVSQANEDGLLAVGGDLSTERLLLAYRSGIFPWFSANEPILWWSPDPRFVLKPNKLKVSKNMEKLIRNEFFRVTFNEQFEKVIEHCAQVKRIDQDGTWITDEMKAAYIILHKQGYAQSVEVWKGEELVGGLYGIDLGHIFCGESMFSKVSNASKFGFIHWVRHLEKLNYKLIDCQVHTAHLESFGAEMIKRSDFINYLHPTI